MDFKLLLHKVAGMDEDRFFARPIREVLRGRSLQHYLLSIRHPMDFFTIDSKLAQAQYASAAEAVADLKLVFTNATKYNQEGSAIHAKASELLAVVEAAAADSTASAPSSARFHKQRVYRHGSSSSQTTATTNHANKYAYDDDYDYDDEDDYNYEDYDGSSSSQLVLARANNTAALLALDRKTIPLFFAHSAKKTSTTTTTTTNNNKSSSSSYYHFVPAPTIQVLHTVTAAGFALDQVTVPCFGVLRDGGGPSSSVKRAKHHHHHHHRHAASCDFQIVPRHKTDLGLMERTYRKFAAELCDKSLRRGLDRIPLCRERVNLDDYELQLTDVAGEEFRDITSFQMPGEEFAQVFAGTAVRDDDANNGGGDTVFGLVSTYREMKRMFGQHFGRAQLAEGDSDLYCLVREPLLVEFTSRGDTVTLKAHLVVVHSAELPKELTGGSSSSSHKSSSAASAGASSSSAAAAGGALIA